MYCSFFHKRACNVSSIEKTSSRVFFPRSKCTAKVNPLRTVGAKTREVSSAHLQWNWMSANGCINWERSHKRFHWNHCHFHKYGPILFNLDEESTLASILYSRDLMNSNFWTGTECDSLMGADFNGFIARRYGAIMLTSLKNKRN